MDVFDAEDEQIVAARSAADDAGIAAKRDNADAAMEAERLRELVRKYQEKGSDGLWTRGVFGIRPGDVSVGDWDTVQLARPTSENLREQHTRQQQARERSTGTESRSAEANMRTALEPEPEPSGGAEQSDRYRVLRTGSPARFQQLHSRLWQHSQEYQRLDKVVVDRGGQSLLVEEMRPAHGCYEFGACWDRSKFNGGHIIKIRVDDGRSDSEIGEILLSTDQRLSKAQIRRCIKKDAR